MSQPAASDEAPQWLRYATFGFALLLLAIVGLVDSGIGAEFFTRLSSRTPGGDKTGHFVLMGTMALLLNAFWRAKRVRIGPLLPLRGSLVVAAAATFEECTQLFVGHRSFSVDDLVYDYLGILLIGHLAVVFAWIAARGRRPSD